MEEKEQAHEDKRDKTGREKTIFWAISGGNTDERILNWPFSLHSCVFLFIHIESQFFEFQIQDHSILVLSAFIR